MKHKYHKQEIRYWAEHPDNTPVWVKSHDSDWVETLFPAWQPNKTYIVKNQWAELRKAQADGATIQQYDQTTKSWVNMKPGWWRGHFYNAFDLLDPKYFRIKQKEWYDQIPKEGVICWVWVVDHDSDCFYSKKDRIVDRVYRYDKNNEAPFVGGYACWENAEPVKPEECWQGGPDV